MPFNVEYDEENDCVVFTLEGRFDLESAGVYASEMSRVLAAHDCKRLLNDFRGAEMRLSTMDTLNLQKVVNEIFAEAGVGRGLRRAAVVPKEAADIPLFFETVAANRGDNVRIFADMDAAMDWLTTQE